MVPSFGQDALLYGRLSALCGTPWKVQVSLVAAVEQPRCRHPTWRAAAGRLGLLQILQALREAGPSPSCGLHQPDHCTWPRASRDVRPTAPPCSGWRWTVGLGRAVREVHLGTVLPCERLSSPLCGSSSLEQSGGDPGQLGDLQGPGQAPSSTQRLAWQPKQRHLAAGYRMQRLRRPNKASLLGLLCWALQLLLHMEAELQPVWGA